MSDITAEQSVNLLLSSIAQEDIALAQIINAEADKILFAIETLSTTATVTDLLSLNRSVRKTMENVVKQEIILQFKFENVLDLMDSLSAGRS